MIRCILNKEITSSICIQLAGTMFSTKKHIGNDPSAGSCPGVLPILTKKENEEIDKAFEVFKKTKMTPRNKAWVLVSTQPSMRRDKTQKEALTDKETSINNKEKMKDYREINRAQEKGLPHQDSDYLDEKGLV